jgi:hypothetical protein
MTEFSCAPPQVRLAACKYAAKSVCVFVSSHQFCTGTWSAPPVELRNTGQKQQFRASRQGHAGGERERYQSYLRFRQTRGV